MQWTKIGAIEPGDEDLNITAKVSIFLFRLSQLIELKTKSELFWEIKLVL